MLDLYPISIPPGVITDGTRYALKGRWIASDKIRFVNGQVESIGGWTAVFETPLLGICRSIRSFANLSGDKSVSFGTSEKWYVWHKSSDLIDITPVVQDLTLVADPIETSIGSTLVKVAVPSPVDASSRIIIAGATGVGGIAAGGLNGEWEIDSTSPGFVFFNSTATASSSATGGGGAVTLKALYPAGFSDTVVTGGWGSGTWGSGPWGGGISGTIQIVPQRIWHMANWGEDLLGCPNDGPIYYWVENTPSTRAVPISGMVGASEVPVLARAIAVTPNSRILVAFATNPIGSSTQDPMLFRWSDNENYLEWNPVTPGSAAGELRFSIGSIFVAALQAPAEIIAWTDVATYAIRETGTGEVLALNLLSPTANIVGPSAAVVAGDVVYWYGSSGFFRYAGSVQQLNCPIRKKVEALIDRNRVTKTVAGSDVTNKEVWFHFVSKDSVDGEPDFYVKYNFAEDVWDIGTMGRTAWADRNVYPYPIAAKANGRIVYQEFGYDDNSEGSVEPIVSYVMSGPIEIDGKGNQFIATRQVIPDVKIVTDAPIPGAVEMALTFDRWPGQVPTDMYQTNGDVDFAAGALTIRPPNIAADPDAFQVTSFTEYLRFRGRGRSVAVSLRGGLTTGYGWSMGVPRLRGRPDGRK